MGNFILLDIVYMNFLNDSVYKNSCSYDIRFASVTSTPLFNKMEGNIVHVNSL